MPKQRKPRDVEEEDEEEEEEDFGGRQINFLNLAPINIDKDLAPAVGKRVKVLKKLQKEYSTCRDAFEKELRALEHKYELLYKPLYARRSEIVTGASDVTDQEVAAAIALEAEEKAKEAENKDAPKAEVTPAETPAVQDDNVKGVPEFWFKVLQRTEIYDELVQKHDEEALKALIDITTVDFEDEKGKGFALDFHFADNKFFEDKVLRKKYIVDPEDDSIDTFEGCEIKWKEDNNLTVKTVIKKQKHKTGKQTRQVKKQEPQDSFFNFFKPLEEPADDADEYEQEAFEQLIDTDIEIAQIFKERIIPRAVDFYLGNIPVEGMNFLDAGDEDDEEGGDVPAPQGANKEECKQQ